MSGSSLSGDMISPGQQPWPGFFFRRLTQRGTKVLIPSYGCAAPGDDVMANVSIRELLLLTCIGTFIASATYAVTLLH
jgi:hypothetical protein